MMSTSRTGRAGRRGFTLVELLTVIAIIGLVLVFALPAFQGIGRGGAMTVAHSQLRATISLARQWAITRRQRTSVVFPDFMPGMGTNVYKAYRAYAVVSGGTYVKEWTFLPDGVRFDHVSKTNENVFARAALRVAVPFPKDGSPMQTLPGITFHADGTVAGGATGCELLFREGWTRVNTATWTLVENAFRPNATTQGIEISYFGTIKFHDYALE